MRLSLTHPLLGTWPTTQACACDWESNWRPFGSQAGTQSTEPHQPGSNLYFLNPSLFPLIPLIFLLSSNNQNVLCVYQSVFVLCICLCCFLYDFKIILERQRKEERENEREGKGGKKERSIDCLFHLFMHSLVDSYVCPDWEFYPQPWCIGTLL